MNRRTILRTIVGGFLLLLIVGVWVYVTEVRPLGLYRAKNREIARRLSGLEVQVPTEIDPHHWKDLSTLTGIGFGNVFFSPQHASFAEMLRFQDDLEEKLRIDQPIGVETLRWIWKRLSQTGPHGKQYSERMILLFEESAAQVTASN